MWSWGKLAGARWRIRHLAPKHSKLQQMTINDDDFAPAATTDRHTEHQEPYHQPQLQGHIIHCSNQGQLSHRINQSHIIYCSRQGQLIHRSNKGQSTVTEATRAISVTAATTAISAFPATRAISATTATRAISATASTRASSATTVKAGLHDRFLT